MTTGSLGTPGIPDSEKSRSQDSSSTYGEYKKPRWTVPEQFARVAREPKEPSYGLFYKRCIHIGSTASLGCALGIPCAVGQPS